MPLMNKHSLDELEIHVLNGDIYGKESKGFSSCCNDDARLSETNHIQYVKIFVLQLGSKEQHGEILELLEDFQERDFRNGKIAYRRAENTPHTNSITQVARLVNEQIGGLHGGVCQPRGRARCRKATRRSSARRRRRARPWRRRCTRARASAARARARRGCRRRRASRAAPAATPSAPTSLARSACLIARATSARATRTCREARRARATL